LRTGLKANLPQLPSLFNYCELDQTLNEAAGNPGFGFARKFWDGSGPGGPGSCAWPAGLIFYLFIFFKPSPSLILIKKVPGPAKIQSPKCKAQARPEPTLFRPDPDLREIVLKILTKQIR
jgi:hypothetical protein